MKFEYVAYIGNGFTEGEIIDLFRKYYFLEHKDQKDRCNFNAKILKEGNAIFTQVIDNSEYSFYLLPYCFEQIKLLYVFNYSNKYDIHKLKSFFSNFHPIFEDAEHQIFAELAKSLDVNTFKQIREKAIDCSFVGYDINNKSLIVYHLGRNTRLYYGYTKDNHEIIFSTLSSLIEQVCEECNTFPVDSFCINDSCHFNINGRVYSINENTKDEFDELNNFNDDEVKPKLIENLNEETKEECGEKVDVLEKKDVEKSKLILYDELIAKSLLDYLNKVLLDVTEINIEKIINNYFNSEESEKKVREFVDSKTKIEIQKHMLEAIKKEVEQFSVSKSIEKELNDKYSALLDNYLKQLTIPQVNIIKLNDIESGRTDVEFFHEKFEEILQLTQLDEPVMLVGPAGSGKNYSVSQIAKALGLHMYYTNNASNEFKLTGFIDAGGNYRETEFYKSFKNGGLFFLDEIDNSDPSALIIINSALANGYMAFPHETIDRHKDFRIVSAANTWGKGSDMQYVGRNILDGATLDRFDTVFFDYDKKLEKALYPNDEVLDFMWSFRNAIYEIKLPHIVSTRGIGKVYKKELNDLPVETILRTNVVKNLCQDDINTILGKMKNIEKSNKYYLGVKSLKLGR